MNSNEINDVMKVLLSAITHMRQSEMKHDYVHMFADLFISEFIIEKYLKNSNSEVYDELKAELFKLRQYCFLNFDSNNDCIETMQKGAILADQIISQSMNNINNVSAN